jgi:hypothetical protein
MARKAKKRSATAQPRIKASLKETLGFAADNAARSLMEQHPMMKKMRNDMHKALMSVARGARGPAARGRQKSLFS